MKIPPSICRIKFGFRFVRWLRARLSLETCNQLFVCAPLAAKIFEHYGVHLFASGAGLYELRHLLVLVQQQKPELKIHLSPAWRLVSKWEQIRPLQHRTPLPKILYMAMVAVSLCWGMRRWAATLMIGFLGMTRIGEALAACRCDLLLPSDNFDSSVSSAFLKIRKPKTCRRGKGRIQHAKLEQADEIQFFERHLAQLDPGVKIFPLSAAAFRARWEKILEALKIPTRVRPTPAICARRRCHSFLQAGETDSGPVVGHENWFAVHLRELPSRTSR